jgi:hypothetical protein
MNNRKILIITTCTLGYIFNIFRRAVNIHLAGALAATMAAMPLPIRRAPVPVLPKAAPGRREGRHACPPGLSVHDAHARIREMIREIDRRDELITDLQRRIEDLERDRSRQP